MLLLVPADLVVSALAGVDRLDRRGLDRLRGRDELGDCVASRCSIDRLGDSLLILGCLLAAALGNAEGDSLVNAMSVYFVFVAVQAEMVAMGLVTVGVTLQVSPAPSCLDDDNKDFDGDLRSGRLVFLHCHGGRARQAAYTRFWLSTVATVPLLRLSKRESASQALGIGDPLLGRGGRGGDDGELSRSGVGLETTPVLPLGTGLEGLGVGRCHRRGGFVGRDGRIVDGLGRRGGGLGNPAPDR